jgi:hydroxymethylbilane synthase
LLVDSFLERNDPREILISNDNKKIRELKEGALIGTSSYRREFQIKNIRLDINCKLLRGNVDTRIKKLREGLYDAIILSYAGIKFLKINKEISEIFSVKDIIPSAGQGIIALQCRQEDNNTISILKKINHKETYQRAHAERNVLKVLEGDCDTAVGAHALIENDQIILQAELFSLDGSQRYYEKKTSKIEDAKELGKEVGQILKIKSNNSYKK